MEGYSFHSERDSRDTLLDFSVSVSDLDRFSLRFGVNWVNGDLDIFCNNSMHAEIVHFAQTHAVTAAVWLMSFMTNKTLPVHR